MRATVVDPTALRAVSPTAATAYLRASGWELVEGLGERLARYRKQSGDEEYFEIDVPLRTDFGDYWRRIQEALHTLELAESRSQLEILADIRQSAFDVVRIAVAGGMVGEGRIGLDAGAILFRYSRELMLSAACAAIDKRSSFATRKPDQAMDYIRRVHLGPTSLGSYVISIESPVSPSLQSESRQQGLPFGDGSVEPETDPYERRVTLTLAHGVAAAISAAASASASGGLAPFIEAIQMGVSSNLCDSLAEIIEGTSLSSLSLRFSWAPGRRPPENTPHQARLEPDIVPILREASKLFREEASQEGFEVEGVPEKLTSPNAAGGGRIMVYTLVEGAVRRVEVELDARDYQAAIQAHADNRRVYCEGELVKEGRRFSLRNPRRFSIRED